ncbi:hypothetical protein D3C72_309030 [compost metagenome]
MSHDQSFAALQESLSAIRQDRLGVAGLCQTWRAQTELLAALPSQYTTVMEDLLGRLEAGSLFTEESCSFSQIDLLTTLDMWLENARKTLA